MARFVNLANKGVVMTVSKALLIVAIVLFALAGFGVALPIVGHTVEFGLAFFAASFLA